MTTDKLAEEALDKLSETRDRLLSEIRKAVVGQDKVIEELLITLLARGHCLLTGIPGLGKTLLVKTVANCLSLGFKRIQFTPDLMPADVLGSEVVDEDPNGGKLSFRFVPGPIFSQVVLADEINRTPPKTQAALLEAMEERQVTVAGETRPLDKPFFVLATQNPIELEGTYPLPEAQLDRFLFKLSVPFPDRDVLKRIGDQTTRTTTTEPEQVLTRSELLDIQAVVSELHTPEPAFDFAARLVLATHPDRDEAPPVVRSAVRFGASPRAMQALVRAGRARALMTGRKHVSTEDIRTVAPLVLTHRVVLGFEAQLDRISAPDIIAAVLQHHRS